MGSRPDLEVHRRRDDDGGSDVSSPLGTPSATGLAELAGTRRLLAEHLPAGAAVLDVGGTGVHASWLAGRGHPVTLVDSAPERVAAARDAGGAAAQAAGTRTLRFPDASFDVVLLLGPLHHVPSRADRLALLGEARRVLRPDGVLVAGFATGHGRTAAAVAGEVEDAGLRDVTVAGVGGRGSRALALVPPLDRPASGAGVLAGRATRHPGAPDPSGHLLAVSRR
ncbi:class I SAM-dependent methyltransferase [Cellulomonas sp. IC4_254]|uniref:class I SAM-dependent methyltransferase n=1 Tax=Cellulomonas sp. IC4_254 TaxID=2714040 RepID=UPI00141FBE54|nr:class I SAM-dependent methyltransferase [Cellulomonas sp. IC4_254]NHT18192.1 class I SAM-dependent methyltransferase [Cellulomonas sp. IC4_254]